MNVRIIELSDNWCSDNRRSTVFIIFVDAKCTFNKCVHSLQTIHRSHGSNNKHTQHDIVTQVFPTTHTALKIATMCIRCIFTIAPFSSVVNNIQTNYTSLQVLFQQSTKTNIIHLASLLFTTYLWTSFNSCCISVR